MTSALLLVFSLASTGSYELVTVLGRPDANKLLVSPQKVVERGDTIIVLDENRPGKLVIKCYTLDGFFVRQRGYAPGADSGIFSRQCSPPESTEIRHFPQVVPDASLAEWQTAAVGPDGSKWAVYTYEGGDAHGLGLVRFNETDDTVTASGHGPGGDAFSISSMRGRILRPNEDLPIYLHVGRRYTYLIASEFLWQYDQQARLIRKVGIEADSSFKEPVGLALEGDFVYVTDFRLGNVWQYSDRWRPGWRMLPDGWRSARPLPESPTYICPAGSWSVWVTDIRAAGVRRLGPGGLREFPLVRHLWPNEGGIDYRIALRDSLLLAFLYGQPPRVLVYDTIGRFVHELRFEENEEHKHDALVGLDNTGEIYGKLGLARRAFRLSPDGVDTTWLRLPDSTYGYELCWQQTWRVAETLYVLAKKYTSHDSPPTHGFFIFVADRFSRMLPDSEFEDGLRGHITDVVLDRDGDIWVVDIWDRTVREYRRRD